MQNDFSCELCNVYEWCRRRCGVFTGDVGGIWERLVGSGSRVQQNLRGWRVAGKYERVQEG